MIAEFLSTYLADLLGAVMVALFGFLGMTLKALAKQWLTDSTKLTLARTAVSYVEQVYQALHGKEKLERACALLAEQLAEKNIFLDGKELVILIEAAVGEMNRMLTRA